MNIHNYSALENMQKDLISEVTKQREKIISDRLNQLGISLDIESEKRKKFKSFCSEVIGDTETIYYNDGTENGLRVITFVNKFDFNMNEDFIMKCTNSYY